MKVAYALLATLALLAGATAPARASDANRQVTFTAPDRVVANRYFTVHVTVTDDLGQPVEHDVVRVGTGGNNAISGYTDSSGHLDVSIYEPHAGTGTIYVNDADVAFAQEDLPVDRYPTTIALTDTGADAGKRFGLAAVITNPGQFESDLTTLQEGGRTLPRQTSNCFDCPQWYDTKTVGTYTYTASWPGDADSLPATTSLDVRVVPQPNSIGGRADVAHVHAGQVSSVHVTLAHHHGTPPPLTVDERDLNGSTLRVLGHCPVHADGTASCSVSLTENGAVGLTYPGDDTWGDASCGFTYQVAAWPTLAATRLGIRDYTLSGRVSVPSSGRLITLYVLRSDGTRTALARTRTTANGTYAFERRFATTSPARFQILAAGDARLGQGYGPVLLVRPT